MKTDPIALNLFLTILGFCVGAYVSAWMASRRVRSSRNEGYMEAVRFYQDREIQSRAPRL